MWNWIKRLFGWDEKPTRTVTTNSDVMKEYKLPEITEEELKLPGEELGGKSNPSHPMATLEKAPVPIAILGSTTDKPMSDAEKAIRADKIRVKDLSEFTKPVETAKKKAPAKKKTPPKTVYDDVQPKSKDDRKKDSVGDVDVKPKAKAPAKKKAAPRKRGSTIKQNKPIVEVKQSDAEKLKKKQSKASAKTKAKKDFDRSGK